MQLPEHFHIKSNFRTITPQRTVSISVLNSVILLVEWNIANNACRCKLQFISTFTDLNSCGDTFDVTEQGATLAPETDCNMPCSGNSSYLCGGPDRISYYTWNGTGANSLYVWNYPTGPQAGSYEFFVPGVVVPLITHLGINGKVTL
jgi:hypothetical protein